MGLKLLPYGEELSTVGNDRTKFATYHRDGTDLDYADQRYHAPGTARLMTSDPYLASGGASKPSTWNRFAYVEGDPVNKVDPKRECSCNASFCITAPPGVDDVLLYAALMQVVDASSSYTAMFAAYAPSREHQIWKTVQDAKQSVTRRAQQAGRKLLASDTNCGQLFAAKFGSGPNSGSIQGLIAEMAKINWIDLRFAYEDSMTISDFATGTDFSGMTIGDAKISLTGATGAMVLRKDEAVTNNVLLGPQAWFSEGFDYA